MITSPSAQRVELFHELTRAAAAALIALAMTASTVHAQCPPPIDGLFDCTSDDDCVVLDQSSCCACNMGGQQTAVNRQKAAEFMSALGRCCSPFLACAAVLNCQDWAAACVAGACDLTFCGNGVVNSGEDCDDGGTVGGDCCSADCQIVANGLACDDGDACTTNDTCSAGACQGGAARSCDDGQFCNGTETCDAALGCQPGSPIMCNVGWCDEQLDTCVSCHTLGCPSDGNPCTDDVCNGGTGWCEYPSNTTPCDDGDPATQNDRCTGGVCVGVGGKCLEQPGDDPIVRATKPLSVLRGGSTTGCMCELVTNGSAVAAVSCEVCVDPGVTDPVPPNVSIGACNVAPGLPAGASLAQIDTAPGCKRLGVFTNPPSALPDGCFVECAVHANPIAPPGNYPVTNVCGASDLGGDIPACCEDGSTRVAGFCGDFDGTGICTIGEIMKCVNCFLGIGPPEGCGAADCNCDGRVTIGEIVNCVNCFLGLPEVPGCPGAAAVRGGTRAAADAGMSLEWGRQVQRGERRVKVGQRLRVPLHLQGNSAATALGLEVNFDSSRLKLKRCKVARRVRGSHRAACAESGPGATRLAVYSSDLSELGAGKAAVLRFVVKRTALKGTTLLRAVATVANEDGQEAAVSTEPGSIIID